MENKITRILASIFMINIDTQANDIKAQFEIGQYIKEINTKYEGLNYFVKVQDTTKSHWKPKAHFTKIFNNEIENAKELYELTKSEVLFLYSLSPYLLWEMNLLVDEEDNPMNQKTLSELLQVDRKTVQRNMKSLEKKKCVYSIPFGKEQFYLINPCLMYCGANINLVLPSLFYELGYEHNDNVRTNRNKLEKRSKIVTSKD